MSVEMNALKLTLKGMEEKKEGNGKKCLNKWKRVCLERDLEVVKDILDLKIGYFFKEEKEVRREYRNEKQRIENFAISWEKLS